MGKKFSPDDFICALNGDTLEEVLPIDPPTIIAINGFFKPIDEGGVMFSPVIAAFLKWIKIPKEAIKEIEYSGSRA